MEKFKTYGAHALSYALSILTIVAGTSPQALPPGWLPWIGAAGLALGGAHNAYAAGAKPQAVVTVAKCLVLCIVLGATLTVLSACAAPTQREQSATVVATYILSGRAIKQNDTDPAIWKARAEQYKAAAVKLQEKNDAGTATIATLAADLGPLLEKLNPSDRLAADALIAALTPYLQEQADANPVVGYSQERLSVILAAFIRSCDAYIGSASL